MHKSNSPLVSKINTALVVLTAAFAFSACGTGSIRSAQQRQSLQAGNSEHSARRKLGKPLDSRTRGAEQVWQYKDGYVVLRDGKVSHFSEDTDTMITYRLNALRAASVPGVKTVIILPGATDLDPADLQYQRYASVLAEALRARGYKVTDDESKAQVAVLLRYSISAPISETQKYTEPVYGMVSSGAITTMSGSTYSTGSATARSGSKAARAFATGLSNSYTTAHTGPEYGVVGLEQKEVTTTRYARFLTLSGYDLKAFKSTGKERQLWRVDVDSVGASGDLREILPLLIASAKDFIEIDTGEPFTWVVSNTDPKVKALVNGSSRQPASD